jgi:cytochrome c peroxidase
MLYFLALGIVGCAKPVPAPPAKAKPTTAGSGTGAPVRPAELVGEPTDTATPAAATTATPSVELSAVFAVPAADSPDDKLTIEEIRKLLDDPKNHQPFIPEPPLGLGLNPIAPRIPVDNPMTRAKVELGRMLYFDKRLSRDSTVSCATCHDPATGWAQDTPVASGIDGQKGGRNSPTVMNRLFGTTQFWDGRAATLEDQALGPIQNPIEMGFTLPELVERLKGVEGYALFFAKIFADDKSSGEVSDKNIAKAIASFERLVLVGASPFDYFTQAEPFLKLSKQELEEIYSDPDQKDVAARAKKVLAEFEAHPLSEAAERGRKLFFGQKAGCSACHVGVNLTDELFYNIGVGMDLEKPDPGRVSESKAEKDTGAFKTPTVRNIAMNAPYMHDGSQKTLMEVVEHYDKGGTPNPYLHPRIKKIELTQQEKEDLVAFMRDGLTGPAPSIRAPKLP